MDPIEAAERARRRLDPMSVGGFPRDEEFADLHDEHGFFRVYMIGRTAPLGGGHRLAHAVAALFPAGLVASAFRRIEESVGVEALCRECIARYAAAGRRRYGDAEGAEELASRLEALVDAADYADRPLAAGWADLPRPDGPGARVERAATVLREHRGGGHVSVLTAHGLWGPDALLLHAAWKGDDDRDGRARLFGWRDDDIAASWQRLTETGRVDETHEITDAGRQEREAIEELTGALAAAVWAAVPADDRARTVELLEAEPTGR